MAQAPIGQSEFDHDTAVTLREPGVYDAELSPGWLIGGAINGGYLLTIIGRSLAGTLPHPHPFSLSAHYLTPSAGGPAVIRTQTVRAGRTLSSGQASLYQYAPDGSEIERMRVLASYGDLDALPDDVRTTAKPPVLPDREGCYPVAEGMRPPGASEFLDRLDVRLDPATAGWAQGLPSGQGEMRGWFDLADGRDPDPFSLLLTADALPPTAFDLGMVGWTPTVELTAHVRCRPAPGRLRVVVTTRNAAGGFLEEDSEIWDSADRLVAQSRQLARLPRV
ncbi:thioesterase family protein [Streptomyces sp. 150FB]|uniref:thioesterase family protein n=1 Tax=Streptomyces sp. 150FB TaxID=1576605 RepID=UPI000697AAA1|nr:thioesterase family protein [Streptomyces sp. 150FB]